MGWESEGMRKNGSCRPVVACRVGARRWQWGLMIFLKKKNTKNNNNNNNKKEDNKRNKKNGKEEMGRLVSLQVFG